MVQQMEDAPPKEPLQGLDDRLARLILKCLEKDPALRPPDMRDLSRRLEEVLRPAPLRGGKTTVRRPAAPSSRWRRRTLLILAGIGGAGVALLWVARGAENTGLVGAPA